MPEPVPVINATVEKHLIPASLYFECPKHPKHPISPALNHNLLVYAESLYELLTMILIVKGKHYAFVTLKGFFVILQCFCLIFAMTENG